MNQHLRIIAALFSMLPLIARADQKPSDEPRVRAITLTKQLERYKIIVTEGGKLHPEYEKAVKEIATLEAELKSLPQLSPISQEYYRLGAMLEHEKYLLEICFDDVRNVSPNQYPDYVIREIKRRRLVIEQTAGHLAILHQKMVAQAGPHLVIGGRKVVPIELDEAEIKQSELKKITDEHKQLQSQLKIAREYGAPNAIAQLEYELEKIEAQIAGKPFNKPAPIIKKAVSHTDLAARIRRLQSTEAYCVQRLQCVTISYQTRQALTQELIRAQREIKEIEAELMPETTALGASLTQTMQAKDGCEKLINVLLAQLSRNPQEEQELAQLLTRIETLNQMENDLNIQLGAAEKAEVAKPADLPVLTRSEPARGQEGIFSSAHGLAPVGMTSDLIQAPGHLIKPRATKAPLCGISSLDGLDTAFPEAPQSSPADFDPELAYANGLANAHLTTENMSEGMDDYAKAIALSLKEAEAKKGEEATQHRQNNKPAAATASATPVTAAELDVKRTAAAKTTPVNNMQQNATRKGPRAAVASKADVDDARDRESVKRLIQARPPIPIATRGANEAGKKTSSASSAAAAAPTMPKPQATKKPATGAADSGFSDSDLQRALAASAESELAEVLKLSQSLAEAAQPKPVAAPLLGLSTSLDDVPPMFGAKDPAQTSKPFNHLLRPTFIGRVRKLARDQKQRLFGSLQERLEREELEQAFRLSQQP